VIEASLILTSEREKDSLKTVHESYVWWSPIRSNLWTVKRTLVMYTSAWRSAQFVHRDISKNATCCLWPSIRRAAAIYLCPSTFKLLPAPLPSMIVFIVWSHSTVWQH